jgi:hypothetical protein
VPSTSRNAKGFLAKLLSRAREGIALKQHYLCEGAILFKSAEEARTDFRKSLCPSTSRRMIFSFVFAEA